MFKRLITICCVFALLLTSVIVFAGCEDTKLEAPSNIEYDGAKLSWTKIDIADYYYVSINGNDSMRTNTNSFIYSAENKTTLMQEGFTVTITAVSGDAQKSKSKSFYPLDTIEEINIMDDGTLYWNEVGGATSYVIGLNGSSNSDVVTTNEYRPMAGTEYDVRVRAVVDGDSSYFSVFSASKKVKILPKPSNIRIDENTITWSGNGPFNLSINNEDLGVISGKEYPLGNANYGDLTVELYSVGDHTRTFDSTKVVENFKFLNDVEDIVVRDGVLNYGSVDNADGYQIMVNDVVRQGIERTTSYKGLEEGKQLRVKVRAWSNTKFYSRWSAEQSIIILNSPTIKWNESIALDGEKGNNLYWDSVGVNVNGYSVKIKKADDSVQEIGTNTEYFSYDYKEVGKYEVSVKALAKVGVEGYTYCDSKWSTPITIYRLPAPVRNTNNFVVSVANDVTKGFTVNYQSVTNAKGYQLYRDGSLIDGMTISNNSMIVTDFVDAKKIGEQKYNYSIKSIGEVKTLNGGLVVTLDTLSSEMLNFEITVLATPSNLRMSGYYAIWDEVLSANGYYATYNTDSLSTPAGTIELSGLPNGKSLVKVCAKGDGASVLASNYTNEIEIYRLVEPKNLRIAKDSGYRLSYDKDDHLTTGYRVFINESEEPLSEDVVNNIYSQITTDGTYITVQAIANKYDSQNSVYYMSSNKSIASKFIKLLAPTFTEKAVENSVDLVWESPSNINTNVYTPNYEVYAGTTLKGVFNTNKYDISNLEGGKQYSYKVRALGDGVTYLDSDVSSVKEFWKLATPVVNIGSDRYNWGKVTNAVSYQVRVNGDVVDNQSTGEDLYYYIPTVFKDVATYTVTFIAVGNGIDVVNSEVATIYQKTQKLDTPVFTCTYTGETTASGAISVSVSEPVANCSKYIYNVGGESSDATSELTYQKVAQSAGTFYIGVTAVGGTFDNENIYYINSKQAGMNENSKIVLLGYPTGTELKINSFGMATWYSVDGALAYEYKIKYDDGEWSELCETPTASLQIENYQNYNKITIQVRAKGDKSQGIITSIFVEKVWNKQ